MDTTLLIIVTGFIAFAKGDGGCKVLDFIECLQNKTFTGHVIESSRVLSPGLEMCQHKCFHEDKCVSYNLGPAVGVIRSCELSDADHVSDPSHVVSKEGSEYCPIKNSCSSNPCTPNQWCSPDFLWDTFKCSDGRWTTWSEWSRCFYPRTRTRRCITPQNTTVVCDGENSGASKESKAVAKIKGCSKPLGMQDGNITNDQITASSIHDIWCLPYFGRLYKSPAGVNLIGSWCAKHVQIGEYFQVDLGSIKWMTKIATQGRSTKLLDQRVTEYTLSFSNNTNMWQEYRAEENCSKHFSGNDDRNTVVAHDLPVPIKTRYVRILPQKWNEWMSMRVELYGCTSL